MYLRLNQLAQSQAGSLNPDLQRRVTDHPCTDEADTGVSSFLSHQSCFFSSRKHQSILGVFDHLLLRACFSLGVITKRPSHSYGYLCYVLKSNNGKMSHSKKHLVSALLKLEKLRNITRKTEKHLQMEAHWFQTTTRYCFIFPVGN